MQDHLHVQPHERPYYEHGPKQTEHGTYKDRPLTDHIQFQSTAVRRPWVDGSAPGPSWNNYHDYRTRDLEGALYGM